MKKRGITLISITIAVIIVFVLLSVVGVSLNYSLENAKEMAFAKEIYNIQSIVTEYINKNGELPEVSEAITVVPVDTTQFDGETFIEGSVSLNVLELTSLDIKNTNYGNKTLGSDEEKIKDVYAVSSTTGKVYYIAGFESGDKIYYTLTDELKEMVEKNQNITIGEKTVTFTASKIGWSNEGVEVKVFVPTEFTSPTITIDNANITYTESSTTDGITYVVNSSKVAEGYTITVNYTKNGTASTASYQAKIDNVAPVISKDANIENTATKVNGIAATDNESGIRYFKYAQGVIDINNVSSYMNSYGKNINGGSIKFEVKSVYTLYAEDKAGNYAIIYINEDGNLTTTKPEEYKFPVIPEGFVSSIYAGEQKVSEGLVIYETDSLDGIDQETAMTTYNQYVWIPVPDINEFVRRDGYYNGKLQTYVSSENATEPFSKTTSDGITLSATNDLTGEYAEYAKMKASVEKYGGFYIARYEAGKDGTTAVSKKGADVWDSTIWGKSMTEVGTSGAVDYSRNMYSESANKEIVSTLIYGIQWDAAINFMKDVPNPNVEGKTYIEDSTNMGWYSNNQSENVEHKTGIDVDENASNRVKNIYDMAGNIVEWTMEAHWNTMRGIRGGFYNQVASENPASYRSSNVPYGDAAGFRVALYIK